MRGKESLGLGLNIFMTSTVDKSYIGNRIRAGGRSGWYVVGNYFFLQLVMPHIQLSKTSRDFGDIGEPPF